MTTPVSPRQPRRRGLRGLGLLAALATLLVVASPASAAQSCGRQVIDDWYDDGRVDGTYELHCYDDAIEILPRDVRDYSSAKEDIQRALQNRMRGKPAPPARTDPSPGTPGDEPTETGPTSDRDDPGRGRRRQRRPERRRPGSLASRRHRERELRPGPAPDPRRPRAAARGGRLGRLPAPARPGPPAASPRGLAGSAGRPAAATMRCTVSAGPCGLLRSVRRWD